MHASRVISHSPFSTDVEALCRRYPELLQALQRTNTVIIETQVLLPSGAAAEAGSRVAIARVEEALATAIEAAGALPDGCRLWLVCSLHLFAAQWLLDKDVTAPRGEILGFIGRAEGGRRFFGLDGEQIHGEIGEEARDYLLAKLEAAAP